MGISDGAHGITLTLPQGMNGQESRISALLVALDRAGQGRLVSAWIKGHAAPFALAHQALPPLPGWKSLLARALRRPLPPPEADRGIALLADRAREAALIQLSAPGTTLPAALIGEAEARGLALVARLMRDCDGRPLPALRLVACLGLLVDLA